MSDKKGILSTWLLLFIIIESIAVVWELIIRIDESFIPDTLPVFAAFSLSTAFLYKTGLKHLCFSTFLGVIAGERRLYSIIRIESLNGQDSMNAAYALFDSIYRGIVIGITAEILFLLLVKKNAEVKAGKRKRAVHQ